MENQTEKLKQFVLADIAAACGVEPSAVSQWLKRNRVPAQHCLTIERFTGGAVTRYDLRPDVFGPPHPPLLATAKTGPRAATEAVWKETP